MAARKRKNQKDPRKEVSFLGSALSLPMSNLQDMPRGDMIEIGKGGPLILELGSNHDQSMFPPLRDPLKEDPRQPRGRNRAITTLKNKYDSVTRQKRGNSKRLSPIMK